MSGEPLSFEPKYLLLVTIVQLYVFFDDKSKELVISIELDSMLGFGFGLKVESYALNLHTEFQAPFWAHYLIKTL